VDFEGVFNPFGYVKQRPATHFNGHFEHLALPFVHHQLTGSSQWVLVSHKFNDALCELAADLFQTYYQPPPNCEAKDLHTLGQVLLYGGVLYPPEELLNAYHVAHQKVNLVEGDILAAMGDCFHFGISTSSEPTFSVAINLMTDEWLPRGLSFIAQFLDFVERSKKLLPRGKDIDSFGPDEGLFAAPALPPPSLHAVLQLALKRCPFNVTCGLLRHLIIEFGRLLRGRPTVCDYPTLVGDCSPPQPSEPQKEGLKRLQGECQQLLHRLHSCTGYVRTIVGKKDAMLCLCTGVTLEHQWADDEAVMVDVAAAQPAAAAAAPPSPATAALHRLLERESACISSYKELFDPQTESAKQQNAEAAPTGRRWFSMSFSAKDLLCGHRAVSLAFGCSLGDLRAAALAALAEGFGLPARSRKGMSAVEVVLERKREGVMDFFRARRKKRHPQEEIKTLEELRDEFESAWPQEGPIELAGGWLLQLLALHPSDQQWSRTLVHVVNSQTRRFDPELCFNARDDVAPQQVVFLLHDPSSSRERFVGHYHLLFVTDQHGEAAFRFALDSAVVDSKAAHAQAASLAAEVQEELGLCAVLKGDQAAREEVHC
jgi:hypothetical protein